MEDKYKVSIILLVYNGQENMVRVLDSLVNQTLDNIEILCVNDGSTDSAPQILDNYAKRYPSLVKVYHKENGGDFTTRNYGLERATGEYVTFIDNDDYLEYDYAEKLYNAAKKDNADIAVCGYDRIDIETNKILNKEMIGFGRITKTLDSNKDFLLFINPSLWNKIFKRDRIKDIRCLKVRGTNDALFFMNTLARVRKISFVPEVLHHYLVRKGSAIHTIKQNEIEDFKKGILDIKEFYIKEEKYEDFKYVIDLFAFIHLGVSIMYRMSYNKDINIRGMLKKTIKFLDENFSTWRKSPFLKFSYSFKGGIKHIGLWGITKMYKWNMGGIYIKLYKFMIDKLKIDIKF